MAAAAVPAATTETAILGGGCFWCVEACLQQLKGVSSVVSGYAGGHVQRPTYEQVCGKQTGHAEVVEVKFDPGQVSFTELVEVFFTIHDPTTPGRQGNDVGPQYRSIILYTSPEQKAAAEAVISRVNQEQWYGAAPVVTELAAYDPSGVGRFWPGEGYHQNYFNDNPGQGYCRVVVAPKVAKFRQKFLAKLRA